MTKQIRSFLLCTLFASTFLLAYPQQQPAPDQTTQQQQPPPPAPQTLRQRLALTKEQFTQFRAINQDRKTQVSSVEGDPSLSPAAKRRRIKSIHAGAETKIRALLNENQLAEYDQFKRERHEKAVLNRQVALPPQ